MRVRARLHLGGPAAPPWHLPPGRWPRGTLTAASPRHAGQDQPPRGQAPGAAPPARARQCRRAALRERWARTAHGPVGRGMGCGAGAAVGWVLSRAWRCLCFEQQDLAPTSTKASVRSLARSITGKWRPATIFTFSFPGMVSARASPDAPAETNKRVCARRQAPRGGAGARGERRERARGAAGTRAGAAGACGVTDSWARGGRDAAGGHSLSAEGGGPARELRPHSGEAAGGVPAEGPSVPVPRRWQEQQKPVNIPLNPGQPPLRGFPLPPKWRPSGRGESIDRSALGPLAGEVEGAGRARRRPEGRERREPCIIHRAARGGFPRRSARSIPAPSAAFPRGRGRSHVPLCV